MVRKGSFIFGFDVFGLAVGELYMFRSLLAGSMIFIMTRL